MLNSDSDQDFAGPIREHLHDTWRGSWRGSWRDFGGVLEGVLEGSWSGLGGVLEWVLKGSWRGHSGGLGGVLEGSWRELGGVQVIRQAGGHLSRFARFFLSCEEVRSLK